jgi:hypothetical protein
MKMPGWDRIYFFVYIGFLFALLGFASLFVIPISEIENPETGEIVSKTFLENGQIGLLLLSLLPAALAGSVLLVVPRDSQPDKTAKINIWVSTFLIYVFVVSFIFVNGILFVPTAILMTAAAVGSQVRRRERRVFARPGEGSKSGRGGGKRRRNKD